MADQVFLTPKSRRRRTGIRSMNDDTVAQESHNPPNTIHTDHVHHQPMLPGPDHQHGHPEFGMHLHGVVSCAAATLTPHQQMPTHIYSSSNATIATGTTGKTDKAFWGSSSSTVTTRKPHIWKSDAVKREQEFKRMHRLVRYIAPEQFRNPSRPTDGPCDIVPSTIQEYIAHRRFMTDMALEQTVKNIKPLQDQLKAYNTPNHPKSVLGKKGTTYETGYSPVLCALTIWSHEYRNLGLPNAQWPTQSQLHLDGDNRQQLATRCGRYLPPPRFPPTNNQCPDDQPFIPILPLDETGPLFTTGPQYAEIHTSNEHLNQDEEFEELGADLVGAELMKEVGPRSEPCVPRWMMKATESGTVTVPGTQPGGLMEEDKTAGVKTGGENE